MFFRLKLFLERLGNFDCFWERREWMFLYWMKERI